MKLKKLRPITNGSRHVKRIDKTLLSRTNRLARYNINKKNSGTGRSKTNGRITVRHKGSGAKKLYRILDDLTNLRYYSAVMIATCYDPNRNSFINLNFDIIRKNFFYSNSTTGMVSGQVWRKYSDRYKTSATIPLDNGDRLQLKNIDHGTMIHNIASNTSNKVAFIRAAGTYGQIVQSAFTKTKVRLPSGKFLLFDPNTTVTIGRVSNKMDRLQTLGKAGVRRNMGIRPSVRGIAMNPVDHPHGGRTNGGVSSMTPWGLKCKGGYYLRKRKEDIFRKKKKKKFNNA